MENMGLKMFSSDQVGDFIQAVGYHAVLIQPSIPEYLHLILAAVFPIFTGAHASLTRPSSAAKNPKTEEADGDEEDVEFERKLEGLTPADAIFFPLMAGATLTGLYYLIKLLEDPSLLNKLLNWYFATFGVFATASLLTDTLGTLHSLIFPATYESEGRKWTILPQDRIAQAINSDTRRISPLPGFFGRISKPRFVPGFLWALREIPSKKLHVKITFRKGSKVEFRLGAHGAISLLSALIFEFYFNFVDKPWWLTNLFGFSFAYTSLQWISPTTALTGCLILGALFFYDIYFVFFTPMMVTVATELDIPAKLMIPRARRPGEANTETPMSMLGLGDIVLPGILIAFALRFDLYLFYLRKQKTRISQRNESKGKDQPDKKIDKAPWIPVTRDWGGLLWNSQADRRDKRDGRFPKTYFYASLTSYVGGMVATLIFMQIYQHAQPALLYLVPCVISSLWVTAWRKGDSKILWDFDEGAEDTDEESQNRNKKDQEHEPNPWWSSILFGKDWFAASKKTGEAEQEPKRQGHDANSQQENNANTNSNSGFKGGKDDDLKTKNGQGKFISFSVNLEQGTKQKSI